MSSRQPSLTDQDLARLLDHSCLSPTAQMEEFEQAIEVAWRYRVATLCIPSFFVSHAVQGLSGSGVGICTTIGFPHGNASTLAKLAEARQALLDGATELDWVVNLSWVKSGAWEPVESELMKFGELGRGHSTTTKLIFETCYLTLDEKTKLAELASDSGLDFVKTSTGFGSAGATLDDVRLLRSLCPARVRVKASGGIRTKADVLAFHEAGADRIGTSSTRGILAPETETETSRAERRGGY